MKPGSGACAVEKDNPFGRQSKPFFLCCECVWCYDDDNDEEDQKEEERETSLRVTFPTLANAQQKGKSRPTFFFFSVPE